MTDDQQHAREAHIAVLQELRSRYTESGSPARRAALGAAIGALRATPECPEGFLMVPEIATEAMLSAAYPRNERIDDDFDRQGAWADCLAARPQGVKDGR